MEAKGKVIVASAGRGKYRVQTVARFIGDDVLISIWGGTKPHVGSVAAATPRPSLEDSRKTSATSSVFNFIGHKDDSIARMFSEKVAASLERNIVATAGVHIDNITKEGIAKVLQNCEVLCFNLIKRLKKII
jgi:hypothetical protein